MKLKRIYSSIIPWTGYKAMTVFPFVFIRKDKKTKYTPTCHRHELTHAYQQVECLWILFFIIYIVEYLIKILWTCYPNLAYRSISFEQEAFANQGDVEYNINRKHFAWVKYIFKLYKGRV